MRTTGTSSSARSLRTRSAIGGWVAKSVATPCRASGLTMYSDAVAGLTVAGERPCGNLEVGQRVGERGCVAQELSAGCVGQVLALARDRELEQRRGNRRDDDRGE